LIAGNRVESSLQPESSARRFQRSRSRNQRSIYEAPEVIIAREHGRIGQRARRWREVGTSTARIPDSTTSRQAKSLLRDNPHAFGVAAWSVKKFNRTNRQSQPALLRTLFAARNRVVDFFTAPLLRGNFSRPQGPLWKTRREGTPPPTDLQGVASTAGGRASQPGDCFTASGFQAAINSRAIFTWKLRQPARERGCQPSRPDRRKRITGSMRTDLSQRGFNLLPVRNEVNEWDRLVVENH
jgi:hypothetical protein